MSDCREQGRLFACESSEGLAPCLEVASRTWLACRLMHHHLAHGAASADIARLPWLQDIVHNEVAVIYKLYGVGHSQAVLRVNMCKHRPLPATANTRTKRPIDVSRHTGNIDVQAQAGDIHETGAKDENPAMCVVEPCGGRRSTNQDFQTHPLAASRRTGTHGWWLKIPVCSSTLTS